MNKQKFKNIVSNPDIITSSDVEALNELANSFPYSQIIHSLSAKAHSITKNSDSQKAIGIAAMYATDRQVLKDLVHSKPKIVSQPSAVNEEIEIAKTEKVLPKHKKITIDVSSFKNESQEVRNIIWDDLEKLKVSKAHYVEYLDREELKEEAKKTTTTTKTSTAITVKKAGVTKQSSATAKKAASVKKKTVTKKVLRDVDAKVSPEKVVKSTTTTKKAAAKSPKAKKTTTKVTSSKKVAPSKGEKIEESLKEIKKKPTKPQKSGKVEEQIYLIDEFIEKKPSISSKRVTSVADSQEDLSVKSTNFGDDLISENLAIILRDQGKVQKAMEMYKKLIWKFPQKKSYFAAQIEALKK